MLRRYNSTFTTSPAQYPAGGVAALATGQPALQPPYDPRLLGPNRPPLPQREAVRADHADYLAVLRYQLPVEGRWRVQVRRGPVAAAAGRRGAAWSVGAESSHAGTVAHVHRRAVVLRPRVVKTRP
jgi:hypothetical protein